MCLGGLGQAATAQELTQHPSSPSIPTKAPVPANPDLGLSNPVEDSVYPNVGDPGIDALHYDLNLRWKPKRRTLNATATITFRASGDAPYFQLDLANALAVQRTRLNGRRIAFEHRGKNLIVQAPVVANQRYQLVVAYAGTPRPVAAPTARSDFSKTGFTITGKGEVWTMQEPYGAYTWYPVNDQPADKALYDFTVTAPARWTGIANGALTSMKRSRKTTTTTWQLREPASSYLITLAIGDYVHSSNRTKRGQRIDYWVLRSRGYAMRSVRTANSAVDWIEKKLGPYPFHSLGLVVTKSQSAMETQTMVTLGDTHYVLSEPVIVHELVHQWFGDQVSPNDWRDVWMNEGFTMLMQWMWEGEHGGIPLALSIRAAREIDQDLRDESGPPGAYDPQEFGSSNVYYSPALMWNELRRKLGDAKFFAIARSWLAAHDNTATNREALYEHWERESGLELTAFFDAWIMGETTPPPGVPTS